MSIGRAALMRGGVYLALYNRVVHLHSLSGTSADHVVAFTGLNGILPIRNGLGVGFFTSASVHYDAIRAVQVQDAYLDDVITTRSTANFGLTFR
jgi:hypothetical protein